MAAGLIAGLAVVGSAMTGCGAGVVVTSTTGSLTLGGKALGGQQRVAGADGGDE